MKCSKCNGLIKGEDRYIIREKKKLCARHYVNEGIRKGDKVVRKNEVITITSDDKVRNFRILTQGPAKEEKMKEEYKPLKMKCKVMKAVICWNCKRENGISKEKIIKCYWCGEKMRIAKKLYETYESTKE